jgi:tripartite-type tricarboxylate transporter receptor subunit TctC
VAMFRCCSSTIMGRSLPCATMPRPCWRLPIGCLAAVIALSVLAGAGSTARANGSPVVRIVVPVPAGGGLDLTARALAQRLAALTGQTHLVENRPGANTAIGSEHVARGPADGRVMLYTGNTLVLNEWLQKTDFTPLDELRAVVQVAVSHYLLVVPAASAVASVQDLRDRAAGPGLNCAAPPGPMSVACEQLRARLGGTVTTVPYPGIAPALTALMGRHVDLMFVNAEAAAVLLQSARLRAIAASSPVAAAGVPLIGQVWPGFLLEGFAGLLVPAGTPTGTVQRINAQVNRVLAEPSFVRFLRDTRQEPAGGTPEHFAAELAGAHRRYGEVIRQLRSERRE